MINRYDECRLLYLTGSESHKALPVSPWRPFGATPLVHTDIEVQNHAACQGHCLEYLSWQWDTNNGCSPADLGFDKQATLPGVHGMKSSPDESFTGYHGTWALIESGFRRASRYCRKYFACTSSVGALEDSDSQYEYLSELATRSIFGWLRVDGYPPTEKFIYMHDWLSLLDSSYEESPCSDTTSSAVEPAGMEAWLDNLA